jgi:hypothetical protein
MKKPEISGPIPLVQGLAGDLRSKHTAQFQWILIRRADNNERKSCAGNLQHRLVRSYSLELTPEFDSINKSDLVNRRSPAPPLLDIRLLVPIMCKAITKM